MKKLMLLVLLFVLGAGCSKPSPQAPEGLPGIPLEIDPTLAIQGANGQGGHACPVNDYVITADHVLWDKERRTYTQATYSDGYGANGVAMVIGGYGAVDLVILEILGDDVIYLPSGVGRINEKVYWFEYDFRSQKNALRARRRFAHILREVAGHYILDEMPVGGSSGSCLLNSEGQVIGMIVAGWETDDGLGVGSAIKLPEGLK